ncbi:MAG: DUF3302 domain-containing protein [Gammaproteobacteria bacterium]|nr:DUF3302 domain-containing protein [Gammaproteobacteria bacterium]QOJ32372.1 MAG: DUF3302 domain-containing protein [Gammaproteobacteria bacterium]
MSTHRASRLAAAAALGLASGAARASFLSGEALDQAADVIAVVVIIIVPIIAVTVFWLVHILPEKVAEKREHPQKDAIKVLCLLSLVFGGMLWPFAWILAYTKPVLHKLAYGRDRHDDYYRHLAGQDGAEAGELVGDVSRLRREIDNLTARGRVPEELIDLRSRLADLESRLPVPAPPKGEQT